MLLSFCMYIESATKLVFVFVFFLQKAVIGWLNTQVYNCWDRKSSLLIFYEVLLWGRGKHSLHSLSNIETLHLKGNTLSLFSFEVYRCVYLHPSSCEKNIVVPLILPTLLLLHLLKVVETRILKVPRRTGASPGADRRLGHHGGVCGLQEVHHWHYRLQQAQPVTGHQESSSKTQDPVLLHVLTQGEGGLPAIRADNQGDLEPLRPGYDCF